MTESAGGVVLSPEGEILVVSQHGTSWSLPKGHIEEGEDAETAARREIKEESGLKNIRIIKKLGDYKRYKIDLHSGDDFSELKHIHIFLFETTETHLSPEDTENPEARWLSPSKAMKLLTHRKDKEFLSSVLNKIITPDLTS